MSERSFATCLFCDDVRQEVGNKMSLMGIYSGGEIIIAGDPPQMLPKFVVVASLHSDVNNRPAWLRHTVSVFPTLGAIFTHQEHLPPPPPLPYEDAERVAVHAYLPIANLLLPADGYIEVQVDSDIGTFRAGRLKVTFLPTPGQEPILAKQSETD